MSEELLWPHIIRVLQFEHCHLPYMFSASLFTRMPMQCQWWSSLLLSNFKWSGDATVKKMTPIISSELAFKFKLCKIRATHFYNDFLFQCSYNIFYINFLAHLMAIQNKTQHGIYHIDFLFRLDRLYLHRNLFAI